MADPTELGVPGHGNVATEEPPTTPTVPTAPGTSATTELDTVVL